MKPATKGCLLGFFALFILFLPSMIMIMCFSPDSGSKTVGNGGKGGNREKIVQQWLSDAKDVARTKDGKAIMNYVLQNYTAVELSQKPQSSGLYVKAFVKGDRWPFSDETGGRCDTLKTVAFDRLSAQTTTMEVKQIIYLMEYKNKLFGSFVTLHECAHAWYESRPEMAAVSDTDRDRAIAEYKAYTLEFDCMEKYFGPEYQRILLKEARKYNEENTKGIYIDKVDEHDDLFRLFGTTDGGDMMRIDFEFQKNVRLKAVDIDNQSNKEDRKIKICFDYIEKSRIRGAPRRRPLNSYTTYFISIQKI